MKKPIALLAVALTCSLIVQCSGNKTQDSPETQNQEVEALDSLSEVMDQSSMQLQQEVQQVENSLDSLLQDLEL